MAPCVQCSWDWGCSTPLFGYFVVLGLLFVLFFKINGRLFDQRTAGVSGLAALALAALFPFSAFSFGPVKTVLLYLGTAPLIGLGTYYLTRIRTVVQPSPAPLALPPAPAVAALPAAEVQEYVPSAPPPVVEQLEVRPAAVEEPAGTPVINVTEPSPITAPDTPADSPVTAMAGVTDVIREESVIEPAEEAAFEAAGEVFSEDTGTVEMPEDACDVIKAPAEGEERLPVTGADIVEDGENLTEDVAATVAETSSVPGDTSTHAVDEAAVDRPVTDNGAPEPVRAEPVALEQPEETAPVAAGDLVNRALAAARRRDFVRAVTLLTEALRLRPEPALEWVIVAHLSDIYQHLGQYRLAAELISAFLSMRQAGDHPLIPILWQKETFCRSLDRLLTHRGTPNLAYASVPENLKGLAFREAMAVPAA